MKTKEKIEKAEKLLAELKAELLKEEPEFKVGDWVCNRDAPDTFIGRVTEIIGNNIYYDRYDYIENCRHATEQEIKDHLVKEAEKRGFKEGIKWKNPLFDWDCVDTNIAGRDFKYDRNNDQLYFGGNTVYYNGKWAEIIKEEPICTIDGVEYSESTLRSIIKKATE